MLAHDVFFRTFQVEWPLVPSLFQPYYLWGRTTVRDCQVSEVVVNLPKDGSYQVAPCEKPPRTNKKLVKYERVHCKLVIGRKYYDLVDGGRRGLDLEDFLVTGDDGNQLFHERAGKFTEKHLSICYNASFSVLSTLSDFKMAFTAGSIRF